MTSGKKIYINKTESAPAVIEKILQSDESQVRLYIPRGATVGHSEHTLSLIKRETETAGKTLIIESVDDDILTLADAIGLHAVNPFFGRGKKAVTDVIVRTSADPHGDVLIPHSEQTEEAIRPSSLNAAMAPEREDIRPERKERVSRRMPSFAIPSIGGWSSRRVITAFGATLVVVGIIASAGFLLPRANVNLVFEHTAWDFDTTLVIDPSRQAAAFDESSMTLPGIVLSEKKNITQTYPASDKGHVERKAQGEVTIYNAYDKSTQALVANTRIESPDGKIFRLVSGVTVPAATMEGGELVPQGVKAKVVADAVGDSYNIGPVSKFTIPGFAGSPRYEGFYAVSETAMTGGFVGETAFPTETDIAAAREQAKSALFDSLKNALLFNVPEGIVVAGDMVEMSVSEESVDKNVNEKGEFSITLYGEARAFGFQEDDFKGLVTKEMTRTTENLVLDTYTIEVPDEEEVGFANSEVTATAHIATVWARSFDLESFKKSAVNKDKDELKTLIFALPGIRSAEVKLWPFWVQKVPDQDDRINVDVTYKL